MPCPIPVRLAPIIGILLMATNCQAPQNTTPKPRGFPRIHFPQKIYQAFQEGNCQFTFSYPQYAQVQKDTSFFGEQPIHPCWFDLSIPHFNARIHCSYYPLNPQSTLEKLTSDAFEMAHKHSIKANYIEELPIQKPNQVSGFAFDIQGPVASPFQFYLTDSTQHFLRASLYLNTQAKPDSLAPIYTFLKKDVMHLINTFEWK